jgi:hypothetical protein
MRFYKVNNIDHKVYDPNDPVENLDVVTNWRVGMVGQWVMTDDDCIIQILRRGAMYAPKGKSRKKEYIGTCTGTFLVSQNVKMDSSRRVNIYSFGGSKKSDEVLEDRCSLTKGEELFVTYLASGLDAGIAYMKSYPTNNPHYASMKAGKLIKTERIKTAMKEELKPVLQEMGVNEEYILKGIKSEAETAEKADTRLKALFKLSDIMDLEDKSQTKITQISGAVFKGFIDEDLEIAERPKEIENGD